jgi:hypothetical protein
MWATLKKIGDFAALAFGGCVMLAVSMCIAAIIGVFFTDPFLPASFAESLRNSSMILFLAFNSIVGSLILLCGYLLWRAWSRKAQGESSSAEAKLLQNFLAKRKLWIAGLSIAAVLLGKNVADAWIDHHKRFDEADRVATGHVVEVDPGEPPTGTGEDADPGRDPSSHYEFQVNGVTYDGWTGDELSQGEELLVRYNSSAPKFNHAQDDHASPYDDNHSIFLLIIVLAALGWWMWKRKPDEPEAN